jgi:hypothetical protein
MLLAQQRDETLTCGLVNSAMPSTEWQVTRPPRHGRNTALTLVRDGSSSAQATDVFDADEIEVLQRILPTLEGKTEKQKNPHRTGSTAQIAWIIARLRLGEWKGYASEAKPSPITLLRSLQRAEAIYQVWKLATRKLVCID